MFSTSRNVVEKLSFVKFLLSFVIKVIVIVTTFLIFVLRVEYSLQKWEVRVEN